MMTSLGRTTLSKSLSNQQNVPTFPHWRLFVINCSVIFEVLFALWGIKSVRCLCSCLSVQDLLKQMSQQKVRPNLMTFNCVLKALRRCGSLGKLQALQTVSEMKALQIGDYKHTHRCTVVRWIKYDGWCRLLNVYSVCVQLPAWPPTVTFWQSFTNQVNRVWCYITLEHSPYSLRCGCLHAELY